MKSSSAFPILGIVSLLCLAVFWAAGSVSLKQVMGWGYRVVYTPQPQGKVEESTNRLAAVHYDLVCATCHGSPLIPQRGKQLRLCSRPFTALASGKNASRNVVRSKGWHPEYCNARLARSERDDEVWSMRIPRETSQFEAGQYQALAVPADQQSSHRPSHCLRCHGSNAIAPVTPDIPALTFNHRLTFLDSFALS